jgi:small subunit ribosomal protein S1
MPIPPSVSATQRPDVTQRPDAGDLLDAELEAALEDLQMDSLMGTEQPEAELEIDSRLKALVTRVHHENVFFSLKGRYEGIASKRQFKTPPEEGAMLEVVITGFKEDEGLYEVTVPGASVAVGDWSDLVEGAIIEARVTGSNTGGLELNVNNIRGFMPASQIDIVRVENFGDYVNQKLQCVVAEVNEGRKKLVLSRRAILEREKNEKKKELLATLATGQSLEGIVTKLMDFGAFVDVGGVEGLVHVSKMSWDRVGHPSEVLQPGQKITVKVEKINPETGKISLSYRDTLENPWSRIDEKYPAGSVVSGTVSRLAQFGAFVKLEPGVEGLVHISELAHHRVIAVKNVLNQGDMVQVKVLSVDPQAQKIGLSLKATQAKPEKPDTKAETEEAAEPIREAAIKKRDEPLKGGRDKGSGGEQFGLNW